MDIILNVFEQGLIFAIVAIGVYITYKILDFPDLSVDGTFPLGACVTAKCLSMGMSPITACIAALFAGCMGGLITGFLHVKVKINNLLSGILVMMGLYSINLRIMGKANVPLFDKKTLFSNNIHPVIILLVCALVVKILLDLYLKTKAGFMLKAVGDNEQLVTMLGVNKDTVKVMGLMISNGIVAFAGSLMAQQQRFSDVGMGTGVVVMGLAAVVLGDSLFGFMNFIKGTTTAALGSIIYRGVVAITLYFGLAPTDLKLITAVIVVLSLYLKADKAWMKKGIGGGVLVKDKKPIQGV